MAPFSQSSQVGVIANYNWGLKVATDSIGQWDIMPSWKIGRIKDDPLLGIQWPRSADPDAAGGSFIFHDFINRINETLYNGVNAI
jgi:hypothetical protein